MASDRGVGFGRTEATHIFQSAAASPHDVDLLHGVLSNALSKSTLSSTHQPRSWSKADAHRTCWHVRDAIDRPTTDVLVKGVGGAISIS